MSNELRILHLRAGSFYGGPERQLHMHALQSKSIGCEITVGSFMERGQSPDFLRIIGRDDVRTHLFETKSPYDPAAISMVRSYLLEHEIDILCTHDYRTQFIGFWAVKRTKVNWIAFSRGWTSENVKVVFYHLIDKVVLRFANHVVAVSDSQKKKLVKLLISGDKISVVRNAISPDNVKHIEKVDLKARFGLAASSIVCISGGRFSREKGTRYLVKAATKAVRKNDQLRFILFGDGPDIEEIRDTISQSGLGDRIMCPGFEENFLGCLKGADLFINPSLSEGLPNVILEAMVLGVPVLATSVGGVPEVIIDKINGFLIPPRDIDALVNGILFLTDNQSEAVRLAAEARKSIDSKFSFERQCEKLNLVYRNL